MINIKLKLCSSCNKEQLIWRSIGKDKYCRQCWLKEHSSPLPKKLPKAIKPKSDKKAAQDQLYTILRNKYFQDDNNKACKARLQECTLISCDVHHTKGRGEYQNDVSTWIPLCRSCHNYIETHPTEAKELNFSQNRL